MKKKKNKFKIDISLLCNPVVKEKDSVDYKIDKHTRFFDIVLIDRGLQLRIVIICVFLILILF